MLRGLLRLDGLSKASHEFTLRLVIDNGPTAEMSGQIEVSDESLPTVIVLPPFALNIVQPGELIVELNVANDELSLAKLKVKIASAEG